MCEQFEIMEMHKQRWVEQAHEKSGLPVADLARVWEGITLLLFTTARSDWPPVSPYYRAIDAMAPMPLKVKTGTTEEQL